MRRPGFARAYKRRPRGRLRIFLDYGLTVVLLGGLILLADRLNQVETRRADGHAVVNDGDSLTMGTTRIRLRGIDAPEYSQLCQTVGGASYACGKSARESLVRLIGRQPVSCSGWRHDRYGRLLGECKAADVDLNRAQVELGWAVAYGGFAAEEAAARAGRVGIWAGTFERPQDWRRTKGAGSEPVHDDMLARMGDWLRQALRF